MAGEDGAQAPKFKLPSFKDVRKQNTERAQLRSNFTAGNASTATARPSNGSSTAAAGPSGQPAQATAQQPQRLAGNYAFGGAMSGPAAGPSAQAFLPGSTSFMPQNAGPARPAAPAARNPQMPMSNSSARPASMAGPPGMSAQPVYPARPPAGSYSSYVTTGNAILVNNNQRGNPVLKCIRNVNHRFADVVPDFQFNDKIDPSEVGRIHWGDHSSAGRYLKWYKTYTQSKANNPTAAVFLSLKFHRLRPQYMHERIKALNRAFRTFLLCHCDVEDPINPLAEVAQGAVDNNVTLLVAFSDAEAARYLELLKAYENKAADALKPQTETDYVARVAKVLTRVRAVNKTDSAVLGSKFRTLAEVFQASEADLGAAPGLGPAKVKRLFAAFDTPFYVGRTQPGAAADGGGASAAGGPPCDEAQTREWAATQGAGLDEVEVSDDDAEVL